MRTVLCGLMVLGVGSVLSAGQLYGNIFLNGQPLRGVPVALNCSGEGTQGSTDGDGIYRVFVRTNGGCTLIVDPGGRNAAAPVYSYDRPTAYNFDLVNQGGRWELILRK